jgi:hypothetical protein
MGVVSVVDIAALTWRLRTLPTGVWLYSMTWDACDTLTASSRAQNETGASSRMVYGGVEESPEFLLVERGENGDFNQNVLPPNASVQLTVGFFFFFLGKAPSSERCCGPHFVGLIP